MSSRQTILVIDDDPAITSALEMLLEHEGRTIILCADLESAELMLERHPVTHVLTDVQFSGPLGFEGLHFMGRIRSRRPDCRVVLMTGLVDETLRRVSVQLGAAAVLAKPFELEQLEGALALDDRSEGAYESLRIPPLDEVIREGLLSSAFQPIVTQEHTVFGFEALARVEGAWADFGINELFNYASKRRQLAELNLAALDSALNHARVLPEDAALFLNVDPVAFEHGDVAAALQTAAARNGFPLSRVVLEITERSGFGDSTAALRMVDRLRAEGVRFALDDHGSAFSHLSLIGRIRPTFIKISQTFGTSFEEDSARRRVVRHIAAMASDFGCLTILEGVESAATARAAAEHGIDLIQGYYFGRPHEASHWTDARRVAA